MRWTTIALAAALAVATHLSGQTKIKVLHNFGSSTDGNDPSGTLLLDADGNLYGVTAGGPGQTGGGVVFQLTPSRNGAWSEQVLHSFTAGSDGAYPWGRLLSDSSGNLYGTVEGYLSYAVSGIFELFPGGSGWSNTILYGLYSGPGLTSDRFGNLYGSMGVGETSFGAIGELTPGNGAWNYSPLYNFCPQWPSPGGYSAPAPPVFDKNGNLWGVTTYGGISQSPCTDDQGCGVVFEMTPNGDGTWAYNVTHSFAATSTDGQFPQGGLVMDAAGNFYGTTELGGAYSHGTVFKLSFYPSLGEWVEAILYDFPNCVTGCFPVGTMAIDKAGNLYGTTIGGVHNSACGGFTCGEVFEMSPQRNGRYKFTVLHKFVGADGDTPLGVILEGNLFGTTKDGGTYGAGTAFELTP